MTVRSRGRTSALGRLPYPKFLKGGTEKEAADFLVPFGSTLLEFHCGRTM